jgi:alkylation response protein AidB-like acyl-CoA dehydrogenase
MQALAISKVAWEYAAMDFGFTDEQTQLAEQVRRFVAAECPLDRVRAMVEGDSRHDSNLWGKMAGLGWTALVVDEAHGGLGLQWEDLVVVAEELGRGLVPSPFVSCASAARALGRLGSAEQKQRWLPSIADGSLVATLAVLEPSDVPDSEAIATAAKPDPQAAGAVHLSGEKMFVADAETAGLLLVAAREGNGVSMFAIPTDAPGVNIEPLALLDPTQSACRVTFDDVAVGADHRLGEAGAAWDETSLAIDAETVALSAVLVGSADAAVTLAAEYAKVRQQFGQLIGKFQGIKHALAEIHVDVESARSLTYYASWAIDNLEDRSELGRYVSMAKAVASEAVDRAGEECVQVHGAIGYTWECNAHLFYKRGRWARTAHGSPERHYERVLASQGL